MEMEGEGISVCLFIWVLGTDSFQFIKVHQVLLVCVDVSFFILHFNKKFKKGR